MITFILMLILVFAPIARGSVNPMAFCVIQVFTILALSIWFFRMFRQSQIRFKSISLNKPILFFVILAVVSVFRAGYKHDSMIEFVKLLNIIAIFYLVINNLKDKRDIKRMVNLIVILGGALSLFGIVQYVGGITDYWWHQKKFISSVYVNHNHFAGFLELTIPLCLGIIMSEKKNDIKLFYIYLITVMVTAFIFSMSRGAWFSLGISMALMASLFYNRGMADRRFFITLLVIAIIGFFIINSINMKLFLNRLASYRDLTFSGRVEIWKGTLKVIRESPFFGTGLGMFIYHFPKYRPEGLNMFVNYAHNDYLQVMAEMGIFGLICMVYMIFLIIKKGFTTYSVSSTRFKRFVTIGATIGVLSIAIHSLADFNLNIPANAILFAVISGLIFNLRSRNEKEEGYTVLPLNGRLLFLLRPVLSAGLFVWLLFIARVFIAEAICVNIKDMNFSARVRALNNAIVFMPEGTRYYKELAQTYMDRSVISLDRNQDLIMASEGYGRAAEINPMDAWAWLGKGDALFYLDSFKEAEYAYKKAVDLDPNNSCYLKRYGSAMASQGYIAGSVDIFKDASRLEKKRASGITILYDAGRPELYIEKGDAYYEEGSLEKAIDMYRIAEGLAHENENIKIRIMDILERTGQREKIAGYISPVIMNNDIKTLLLNSRARYLMSKGGYPRADKLIEKALYINGKDIRGLQNKIDLLQKQKKPFNIVRPYIERLVSLNKDAKEIIFSGKNAILKFDFRKSAVKAKDGSKEISFLLPVGIVDIKLVCAGNFAQGEWPHMLVKANSGNILSAYVESSLPIELGARFVSKEYYNRIQIQHMNDYWNSETKENRNIRIETITLEYKYPDYED